MKKSLLLLGLVLLGGCKIDGSKNVQDITLTQGSIINGIVVKKNNVLAKSVVALYVKNYQGVWTTGCTGTVLDERFILTAGHCLNYKDPQELLISFSLNGKKMNSPHALTRKVKSFRIHPEYSDTDNDFGIILLETKIPDSARAVTLLPDKYLVKEENKTTLEGKSYNVTLMGFGIIKEDPYKDTDVLRVTTVPARFENQLVITDQTKGSGGCNGDSGGPAFLTINGKTYQAGVTSGPHGNSTTCHEEGEWMNPALDQDFIQESKTLLLNEEKS